MKLLLFLVRFLPLARLGPLMDVLAEKVINYRKQNNGHVPIEVFTSCCAIGGATITFELVIRTPFGLMLKKRGEEEQGWNGHFHIPGSLLCPENAEATVKKRVLEEAFGAHAPDFLERLSYACADVRRDNTERRGNCVSIVLVLDIQEREKAYLVEGEWRTIPFAELQDNLPEDVDGWAIPFHWRLFRQCFMPGSGSKKAIYINV